ncbi:MAG: hypothetical protein SFZ02_12395 [bacterium]|nr:hypothetical protein [bacterium]
MTSVLTLATGGLLSIVSLGSHPSAWSYYLMAVGVYVATRILLGMITVLEGKLV